MGGRKRESPGEGGGRRDQPTVTFNSRFTDFVSLGRGTGRVVFLTETLLADKELWLAKERSLTFIGTVQGKAVLLTALSAIFLSPRFCRDQQTTTQRVSCTRRSHHVSLVRLHRLCPPLQLIEIAFVFKVDAQIVL